MDLKETQKGYLEIGAAVAIWAIASGVIVRWINQGAEIEIGAEVIYGIGAAAGFFFVLFWLFLKKETAEIKKISAVAERFVLDWIIRRVE